jgi:hypothetical protein
MLEGSNRFVAMVTAIGQLRTTKKTVLSSDFQWRSRPNTIIQVYVLLELKK